MYKFCCVRAMPIWLVDNRCITINVLQLPVHYPLHAEEAYSESTWIPKKENKGQKTSNQWRQEYFWSRIGRTQCTSAQRGQSKETQQRSHQGNTVKVATFPSRSSYIDQLHKTVLSEISSSYPFFAIHECTVSFNNNCKINRRKMSFTVFNAILIFIHWSIELTHVLCTCGTNLCILVLVWGCDPSERRVFVTGHGCRRSANGSLTQLHGANYSGKNGPLLKLHFKLQYLCISYVSACKRTGAKVQKNWCRVYKSVRRFEKLGGNIP